MAAYGTTLEGLPAQIATKEVRQKICHGTAFNNIGLESTTNAQVSSWVLIVNQY